MGGLKVYLLLKATPPKSQNFWKKVSFLSKIFGTLHDFYKSAEKCSKFFDHPLKFTLTLTPPPIFGGGGGGVTA
jgi:hypothetical protein